mmetsp:Transcript_62350/g.115727  ORF Transcript_62350/g.115727 Transcript_62350/m.115727 type:complete len:186 (+) Transcript_62350:96-653(+)
MTCSQCCDSAFHSYRHDSEFHSDLHGSTIGQSLRAVLERFPLVDNGAIDCECAASAASEHSADDGIRTEPFTTVLFQNLPRRFHTKKLLMALDAAGYKGCYDFVHVPVKFSTGTCYGYAFINFTRHSSAMACLLLWHHSSRFCDKGHDKHLEVTIAHLQGWNAHQRQLRKFERVRNKDFRPFIAP